VADSKLEVLSSIGSGTSPRKKQAAPVHVCGLHQVLKDSTVSTWSFKRVQPYIYPTAPVESAFRHTLQAHQGPPWHCRCGSQSSATPLAPAPAAANTVCPWPHFPPAPLLPCLMLVCCLCPPPFYPTPWGCCCPRSNEPIAYHLHPAHGPCLLAQPDSPVAQRGLFTTKNIWVTPHEDAQLYPAGTYVFQSSRDSGLGVWTQQVCV
jgi:hypothetical protein